MPLDAPCSERYKTQCVRTFSERRNVRHSRDDRLAGLDGVGRAACDRRGHERHASPSRAGRRRRLGGSRERRDAVAAPPRHYRSERRRGATDALGRPPPCDRLQRGDLQLPRHPPRTGRLRPVHAQRFRHRGAAGSVRRLGRRKRDRTRDRHVRFCALGSRRAHAVSGARSDGHQADVLRGDAGPAAVCVRAQGAARRARLDAEHRRGCGRRLFAARLHRAAAHDLPRSGETAARPYPHCAPGRCAETRVFLGFAQHCDRGPIPQRSRSRPGGGGRASRRAAARRGATADDRRCAARRIPVGRDRFIDRRRPHAGAEHAAGEDVLDRVPRARLRRGAACPPGRRPSRRRPHRVLCRAAPRARRHSAPARVVRRAVRRPFADPHFPRLGTHAPARHRRSLRRRRGRIVRRLSALRTDAAHGAGPERRAVPIARAHRARVARAVPRRVEPAAPMYPLAAAGAAVRRQAPQGRNPVRPFRRRTRSTDAWSVNGTSRTKSRRRGPSRMGLSGTRRSRPIFPRSFRACNIST